MSGVTTSFPIAVRGDINFKITDFQRMGADKKMLANTQILNIMQSFKCVLRLPHAIRISQNSDEQIYICKEFFK